MQFLIIGILFVLTSPIMAFLDGARDDEDLTMWMIKQPLQNLLMMRAMMVSGVGFVLIGLLSLTMPA